jgi:hypothetical protein
VVNKCLIVISTCMTINLLGLDDAINLHDYICIMNLLVSLINLLMLYVVMYSCAQICKLR